MEAADQQSARISAIEIIMAAARKRTPNNWTWRLCAPKRSSSIRNAPREDATLIGQLAAEATAYVPFFPLGGFRQRQSRVCPKRQWKTER
jgi:hypothetical protein